MDDETNNKLDTLADMIRCYMRHLGPGANGIGRVPYTRDLKQALQDLDADQLEDFALEVALRTSVAELLDCRSLILQLRIDAADGDNLTDEIERELALAAQYELHITKLIAARSKLLKDRRLNKHKAGGPVRPKLHLVATEGTRHGRTNAAAG